MFLDCMLDGLPKLLVIGRECLQECQMTFWTILSLFFRGQKRGGVRGTGGGGLVVCAEWGPEIPTKNMKTKQAGVSMTSSIAAMGPIY